MRAEKRLIVGQMPESSENPYQSPSLAVAEESAAPPSRFSARERRSIEQFVWLNQIVASCVIGFGVVLPVALCIGFASGVSAIPVGELIRFSAIMAVVLAVGIFQAVRNIYAITATGVAAVLILLWIF